MTMNSTDDSNMISGAEGGADGGVAFTADVNIHPDGQRGKKIQVRSKDLCNV